MFRAYKYRLEPNANQTRELEITLETHRRLYNQCLQQRGDEYQQHQKSVKYTDQSRWFKQERQTNQYFARLNFSSAQATMRRLDKAFQAFFRRVKAGETPGYPRFKARDRFGSFTYPAVGDGIKLIGNKVRLQHIGTVRINLHRPWIGELKTVTIRREGDKWFVVLSCEIATETQPAATRPSTGIDVGIENFLMAADGFREPTVAPLKHVLAELRVEQRSLSRKSKRSRSRAKQRRRVRRLHARVANVRRDAHHKIANKIISRYGSVAVESLNIRGMLRNHRLARAVLDAGWNSFIQVLKHKAENAGVQVVEVSARGTSQTCPACGQIAGKPLHQRWHACDCGYSAHRDQAAAEVILHRGLLAGMRPGSLNVDVGLHGFRSRPL